MTNTPGSERRRSRHLRPILGLLALTLIMFGDVLLSPKAILLSSEGADIFIEDVYWREFAFGELRKGNFPLWNPHIFSGTPFFGGFQSGLLYPLNLHYLVLPVHRAINLSVILHVFLVGLFSYLWAAWRGLRPLSAFACGVMVMFSGAYFMNVFAGHLGPVGAMAWTPLVLLSIDMILDRPTPRRALLGMLAVTMLIFSDAPQYVFITAVTAAMYSALRWLPEPGRGRRALAMGGMCLGAAALTAVEFLPSYFAASETTRAGGVPFEFASSFAFPPENLITMIAPHFFGNMVDFIYWGRCLLWEMLPTIGVVGLTLAAYGAFRGRRRARRWCLLMTGLLLLIAIGRHTPLFSLLYQYVPGFSNMRGISKFTYPMVLFLVLLSGAGLDHLLRTRRVPLGLLIAVAGALVVLTGLGFYLALMPSGGVPKWWVDFMAWVTGDKESLLYGTEMVKKGSFIFKAARTAGWSLVLAAAPLFVLGLALTAGRFFPRSLPWLAALIVLETFVFARSMRPTFAFSLTRLPVRTLAKGITPEDRTLFPVRPDCAMALGTYDAWGYGPFVSQRYAELMAFTQGQDPDDVVLDVPFKKPHPIHVMLRCRYYITEEGGRLLLNSTSPGFPHALIVPQHTVMAGRDAIFAALAAPDFAPERTVILEEEPVPAPAARPGGGAARVVEKGTDHLVIEAETPEPAILLVTDTYAKGWHAQALPGSAQQSYVILPANYVLRAVPLEAGHHRIRMEYRPRGLLAGICISLSAVISLLLGFGVARCLRRRPPAYGSAG